MKIKTTRAIRFLVRLEIYRLRRKHHKMRIDFMNDDKATEQDAVNVMSRDNNIRFKIQELKRILNSGSKVLPQVMELYS